MRNNFTIQVTTSLGFGYKSKNLKYKILSRSRSPSLDVYCFDWQDAVSHASPLTDNCWEKADHLQQTGVDCGHWTPSLCTMWRKEYPAQGSGYETFTLSLTDSLTAL